MPTVELVYDSDCPNLASARVQLLRAFAQLGIPAVWYEWRAGDPDAPERVRAFGSPTLLVDGVDVSLGGVGSGASCRLYRRADGALSGVPEVHTICAALSARRSAAAAESSSARHWFLRIAAMPGLGAALLPKVVCPACWPAYAGLLTSLGLGFLLETAYLVPFTTGFLAVAVASLAYRARSRRGYGPCLLAGAAAAGVLFGKFALESDVLTYVSLCAFVVAAIWNAWPVRDASGACASCDE